MEPEFVDCTNFWTVKEEPQEVEDVLETDTTGEEDCIGDRDEIQEEGKNVAIKQELEDEEESYADDALAFVETEIEVPMKEDSSSAASSTKNSLVFACIICNKTYTAAHYLAMHRKTCRGLKKQAARVKPERGSTDVQSLARRIDGVKMYCCQYCNHKATDNWKLKQHLATHSGERPFQCEVCEKTFARSEHLIKHKRIHTGEKPHKCTQCDKAFTEAGHLNKHMTVHTGERKFACTMCEYKAARNSTLIDHLRVHTGDKPFSCTQCEYETKQRANLKRHIQMKHTDERPYSCDHCEYRTTNRSDLTKHIKRKHT